MPIILDTCVLHKIIPPDVDRVPSYELVHQWLNDSRSTIAIGGSKYRSELAASPKYLGYFAELERASRVVKLDNSEVDKLAVSIINKVADNDLDDEHIIAIAIISRAFAVCTADQRAEKFIKMSDLYPRGAKKPRIIKKTTTHNAVSKILSNNT